jgi:kumamolisin
MIDIAISGSVAPGAEIIVYFSKGSTNGFYNAIDQAVNDTKHKPSIISISWGSVEGAWGQLLKPTNHSLMNAAVLGRTVICATGDHGSSDLRPDQEGMVDDQFAHIEFPASSPFVLACGGTKLFSSNAQKIRSEVVWNDGKDGTTGGGVSEYIKRPKYQDGLRNIQSVNKRQIHGRCIPDIAAFASPGYNIPVHGQKDPKGRGGTSAAAPLWAALIALINQSVGSPAGFINPLLYEHSAFVGVLSDITKGNNIAKDVIVRAKDKMIKGSVKGYYARIGWDACTGLGTPNGLKLLKALSGKIFRGTKRGKTEYQHLGPRN